jgi:uncharacterized protein
MRYIRLIVLLTCSVLFSPTILAFAQGSCPPVPKPLSQAELLALVMGARDRGPLWTIEKNGRRSYLYGTVHMNKREWTCLGPRIVSALHEAEVIAVELDTRDPAVIKALDAKLEGEVALPPDVVERIRRQTEKLCALWPNLEGKPWARVLFILQALSARWDGFESGDGVEAYLGGFAATANKRIVSLETVEEQRRALMGGSIEEQRRRIDDLLTALEEDHSRQVIGSIAKAWAAGDLNQLGSYIEGPDAERLIFERNAELATRIEALHDSGVRVFAGIGILHTVGGQGVPELLKRSFKVERIEFAGPK